MSTSGKNLKIEFNILKDTKKLVSMIEHKSDIIEVEICLQSMLEKQDIHITLLPMSEWAVIYRIAIKSTILELQCINQNYNMGLSTDDEYINQTLDATLYQDKILGMIQRIDMMDDERLAMFKGFYQGYFYHKD